MSRLRREGQQAAGRADRVNVDIKISGSEQVRAYNDVNVTGRLANE